MKLHVLIAQRREDYPGQYAPEALEVMDDCAMSDNPGWLHDKLSSTQESSEYSGAGIFCFDVGEEAEVLIKKRLAGENETLTAQLKE